MEQDGVGVALESHKVTRLARVALELLTESTQSQKDEQLHLQ